MYKKIFLITLASALSIMAHSQELRCRVSIVSSKIQRTDRQIFETMQTAIYEYMNNTSWTNHVYSDEERIECAILINLEQQTASDEFSGTIQVQASRPVFNSSYNTVLLNYKDNDVQFSYIEHEPLDFSLTVHTSNLSSLLAYYAYLILGLDYDSFSNKGGTEYFQKAETIVSNAQNAKEKGWKAFESSDHKNRYWVINNLLDSKYEPIREFYYQYHRQGLDKMSQKVNESRAEMAKHVLLLQKVYRQKPDNFLHLLKMTIDAKRDEFINIFGESPMEEKTRVIRILTEIDPANTGNYKKLQQENP